MDNINSPNFVNVSGISKYINNYSEIEHDQTNENNRANFNPLNYIPINNNNTNIPYQPEFNQNISTSAEKYETEINSRMNSFAFDQNCFVRGSLVPVDRNHFYSRNLFQEGIPIPQDLQNKKTNERKNLQPHLPDNQFKNGHQFRPKTMYKDELNNRLQNLSPVSNKLFTPFDSNQQTPQFMPNPQPSWQKN